MFKQRNRLTREFIKANSVVGENGCWNWTGHCQSAGYGQFRYRNHNLLAHRASYSIFKDIDHDEIFDLNDINGLVVCHTCDNSKCVNPDHLFAGTQQDNIDDCRNKGRENKDFSFSRKSRVKKLSNVDVLSIYGSKESLKFLSEKYGVSVCLISFIRNGKRKQLVTRPSSASSQS